MKLAFSTLGCLDATAEQVTEYAIRNGISGIEPRVNDKGETFVNCTAADTVKLRDMFNNARLTITDLALSCSLREYDSKQIETGRNGIDFAAGLGCHGVRIFAGAHQSRFSDRDETDREGMKKAILELSDYGKDKNVDILIETHSTFSSGRAMKGLLDELDRDNIKVIWDVLHSLEYRETPEETVNLLGDKIVHVHLKDGFPSSDEASTQYIHSDLGKGTLPVKRITEALDGIGYNGFYSLEWESPWRNELKGLYPDFNVLLKSYNRFLGII